MGGKGKAAGTAAGGAGRDVAVRERLLRGATEIFTRRGYAGTTVREIVAAAGVTKPALYYYFRNKEGIYLELMRNGFSRFDAILEESGEKPGGAAGRIKRLSGRTLDLIQEHIGIARLMYAIYYGPPQGAPFFDFEAYHLKFREAMLRLVEEGIRNGEFRKGNAEDMMWPLIGAVNVAMEAQLCHEELGMDREKLGRVIDIIFEGISAEGRPVKGPATGQRRRLRKTGLRGRSRIRKGETR